MDAQQLLELLAIENKIKNGAETMLQVIDTSQVQARQNVEETLTSTNQKIKALNKQIQSAKKEGILIYSNMQRLEPSTI
jgi:hypothetical protein